MPADGKRKLRLGISGVRRAAPPAKRALERLLHAFSQKEAPSQIVLRRKISLPCSGMKPMEGLFLPIRTGKQKFSELPLSDDVSPFRSNPPKEFRRLRIDRDSKTVLVHARKPCGAFRIVFPRSTLKAANGLKHVLAHAASFRIADAKVVQGGDVAPLCCKPPQFECARAIRISALAAQCESGHSVQSGDASVASIEFLRFAMASLEFRTQSAPIVRKGQSAKEIGARAARADERSKERCRKRLPSSKRTLFAANTPPCSLFSSAFQRSPSALATPSP